MLASRVNNLLTPVLAGNNPNDPPRKRSGEVAAVASTVDRAVVAAAALGVVPGGERLVVGHEAQSLARVG